MTDAEVLPSPVVDLEPSWAGFVFFVDPDPHNLKKGKKAGQKFIILIQIFLAIFLYCMPRIFSTLRGKKDQWIWSQSLCIRRSC